MHWVNLVVIGLYRLNKNRIYKYIQRRVQDFSINIFDGFRGRGRNILHQIFNFLPLRQNRQKGGQITLLHLKKDLLLAVAPYVPHEVLLDQEQKKYLKFHEGHIYKEGYTHPALHHQGHIALMTLRWTRLCIY